MIGRGALLLAAFMSLASCGNDRGDLTPVLANTARSLVGFGGAPEEPQPTPAQIRASLTPEALAQVPGPLIFVEFPDLGVASALAPIGENQGVTNWRSARQVSILLEDGFLRGTRGLGGDLMTTDIEEPLIAIRRGRGEGVRVHRYVNPEDLTVTRAFRCVYDRDSGSVRERCYGNGIEFENRYVLGRGGQSVKSRQWIGPLLGYVEIERLK